MRKIGIYIIPLYIFICLLVGLRTDSKIAYAKESNIPTVTVQSRTGEDSVHRGQAFTLDVILTDNTQGLTGLYLTLLSYDKDVFTLLNVEETKTLELEFGTTKSDTEEGFAIVNPRTGGFDLFWGGSAITKKDMGEGVIATLTFSSRIDADLKDYLFEFNFDADNTRTDYQVPIGVDVINSVVTLITGEYVAVYQDYDGSILYSKDCLPEDVPSFPYVSPIRDETPEYYYEFDGWESVVSQNKKEIVYRAKYIPFPQEYQIFYYVDGEYYSAIIGKYKEAITVSNRPSKKDYTFDGWYTDEGCTTGLSTPFMPAHDVYLYGVFKYNIREKEIPQLEFIFRETVDDVAYVDVYVIKNTGVNAVRLTPEYDRKGLTLIGYEKGEIFLDMDFNTSKVENLSDYSIEDFHFYWGDINNNYELGKLITLKFYLNPQAEDGNYYATFTYEPNTDATYYVEGEKDPWYTKLEIISTNVPKGLRYHWNEEVNAKNNIDIDIISETGKPYNVELVVEDITIDASESIDPKKLAELTSNQHSILSVYTTYMTENHVKIDPKSNLTIRIKLTPEQKRYKKLTLVYIDSAEEAPMRVWDSKVEDGYLVFTTDRLSDWAILCEDTDYIPEETRTQNTFLLIVLPSLLAIATMGTFLIYMGLRRKKSVPVEAKETDMEE